MMRPYSSKNASRRVVAPFCTMEFTGMSAILSVLVFLGMDMVLPTRVAL
jgi:hypothetical protein